MIHPFIAENFAIKAILTLHEHQNAPADVVLLDLSDSPMAAVADLLDVTNCQMIHAGPDAILKIILLTQLHFGLDETNQMSPKTTTITTSQHQKQQQRQRVDIPCCPVCLYRIDPVRLGTPVPPNLHMCSKFCQQPSLIAAADASTPRSACPRQRLLQPWPPPSHCVACHCIQTYWKEQGDSSDLFCCQCAMQETLWVCLTCGFVGCGRYSKKHAAEHFVESNHPYSLELATLRTWDYVTGEFVHRIDLLECASSPPLIHPWIRRSGSRSVPQVDPCSTFATNNNSTCRPPLLPPHPHDEKTPKKATLIGEEYEALLQSALEDQAQHYEGEIMRLRAALAEEQVDAESMTVQESQEIESIKDDIGELRTEIDQVGRQLLDLQAQEAGHRATSQRLLREQQVSQDVLKNIREESAREHLHGKTQVEELEQQIADLTANQRMRDQFSHNEELLNAQIFGASAADPKSIKKGKKSRRFVRK